MAINITNLETVLNTKIASATSSTPEKDLLIISKSVEALDSSISLKPEDIGVTVQAFDATNLVDGDIGVTVQAYDATIVVDGDIGVTVQAYDANAATTSDVTTAVAALVDSAPGTLDTLNELAAALGDDANHVTTMTNLIADKLPLAGGTLSGNLDVDGVITVSGHTGSAPSVFEASGNGDAVQLQLKVKANNGSTSTHGLYGNAGNTSADNTLCLGANSSTGLTINSSGNVGIGTSSPDHILSLSSTTPRFGMYTEDGGNANERNWMQKVNGAAYGSWELIVSDAKGGNPQTAGSTAITVLKDGNVGMGGNLDLLTYTETTISTSGTIDLSLGTVFTHTHTGGMSSFTLSNVPTTGTSGFILILENGGSYPLTWWTGSGGAAIKWPAATPPTLTSAGTDVFTFTTTDNGTTWYGIPSGIGMA